MLGAIIISWGLTFGMVPERVMAVEKEGAASICEQPGSVATLDLALDVSRFSLYTSVETYQNLDSFPKFTPMEVNYIVGTKFKASDMVTFGVEHECDHPVSSGTDFVDKRKFYHNQTRIYISFRGRTSL